MKLLQEFVNQADLAKVDGSDAGSTDVKGKGAEVKFDLMRNTINSDGQIKGSDVANYLERAQELNDEVETVLYGLETSDGDVVKVYVNATQADAFEAEMKKMLGMEDDIEEAINNLASKFDIVDVIWPKGSEVDGETEPQDDINLDDAADIGNPDDAEEDDDLEPIASVDDEETAGAAPPVDDEETGGVEDAKKDEPKKDEPKKDAEEEPASDEASDDETEEAPADKKDDKKDDKKEKKGDKHSLLKSIGGGLAGKSKVAEGKDPDAHLVKDIKTALRDGDDYKAKALAKLASTPEKVKELQKLIKDEMHRVSEGEVIHAKFGKPEEKKQYLSMLQAFGSREIAAADEAGIKLTEKPSYWEDFEGGGHAAKKNLTDLTLKKLEKTVGSLPTYSGKEIYGTDVKPRGPLAKVTNMPKEDMFIVKFDDGSRYVADQTGASTYIRMWQKIN